MYIDEWSVDSSADRFPSRSWHSSSKSMDHGILKDAAVISIHRQADCGSGKDIDFYRWS